MVRFFRLLLFITLSSQILAKEIHTIPFQMVSDRILVAATVNGVQCNLLYDTGAFGNSIDSTFAVAMGLKIGSRTPLPIINLSNFSTQSSFGSLNHRDYSGGIYDGIIGIRFFQGYLVEIDYQDCKLRLFRRDDEIVNDYQLLPTSHIKNNMVVFGLFSTQLTLSINGNDSISGNFIIDTGSSRNITLLENHYSELKKASKASYYMDYFNASHHGFDQSAYFKITSIDIANTSVDDLIVDCSFGKNGEISKHCDGIIGAKFLRNFNLLIDYEGSSIYIRRNTVGNGFVREYVCDGVTLKPHKSKLDVQIVSSLVRGSSSSLRLGDEVVAVNGEKITEAWPLERRKEVGERIFYTIRRKKKTIEVETVVKRWL